MIIVLYNVIVSPHQLPLALEIKKRLKSAKDSFFYIYTHQLPADAKERGWEWNGREGWILLAAKNRDRADCLLKECDVLLSGIRDAELFIARQKSGRRTFYMSERWFKPPIGMLRLLHPIYFKMAKRLIKVMRNEPSFTYLPIGVHAARDIARLCGLMHGDLRCLFRAPKLDFEHKPGGRIWLSDGVAESRSKGVRYCLDKMRMWGYFVEASRQSSVVSHQCQSQLATNDQQPTTNPPLTTNDYPLTTIKVLWVGRLLNLKRVDTIVRAVGEHANLKRVDNSLPKITLDIYGTGPEETRLKKLAAKYDDVIKFYPPVPIDEVRRLMREHDIYVLASNAYEGWGAVVSEALEEGMKVIGTYEAGSSATILQDRQLFHTGKWRDLQHLLELQTAREDIGLWSVNEAAKQLANYY